MWVAPVMKQPQGFQESKVKHIETREYNELKLAGGAQWS